MAGQLDSELGSFLRLLSRRLVRLGPRRRRHVADPHAADAPAVDLVDGEPPPLVGDGLADVGHVLERAEDEPADGVPVLVRQRDVEQLVDVLDRCAAIDDVVAVRQALDTHVFDVVLVDDLADELLETVLQRDQSGDSTVFVGDDRQVELVALHFPHQPGHRHVLRDEAHLAGEIEHRLVAVSLTLDADQVFGVGEPDDVVTVMSLHRHTAHAMGDRQVEGLGHGGLLIDDEHVGSGNHDLARRRCRRTR